MTHPRNPYPTVDVIVEMARGIVLIERRNPPPGWALPGGFIDYGEDPEAAGRREVKEETGLDVELTDLLGVYGAPDRDPRQHNLSVVYVGRASGEPKGSDDATRAGIFAPDAPPSPLAFDHARILADYRHWRATGERPRPSPPGLSAAQSKELLRMARAAIEAAVAGRSLPGLSVDAALMRPGGSFVTLRNADHSLRGCIGDMSYDRPLAESVQHSAAGAALRDPRFPPLTASEIADLRIAISVLGPLRPLPRLEELEVGRHGLLMEQGPRRGVLLPEVASEQRWTREEFLAATCRKAGLPPDAWRAQETRISVFETLKIAEER